MRRSLALLLSFALCLPAAAALAQAGLRTEGDVAGAQSPYDAEVPVNSQSEADRNGAVARALGVVLVTRLLRDLLYGVPRFYPLAIGMSVVILLACATVALLIPVRRATRVDPTSILR